ncbi:GNAT family N-acetyltransferase [Aquihabitans sp. G128]|uniref:GNAT family N-acetyltransferase n=1 Tax=Aquihabitans sp. G128 TaxID=2849779 RepID=UPI001C249D70|nr:GNAT family N-acetyltransferase [Aquihabitans sp. G128]QXC63377.1 GNAT family N-acetyltransferase [Aquihabitans sp. G128]
MEQVPEAATERLRYAVLRPHDPDDPVLLPVQGGPPIATFAAFPAGAAAGEAGDEPIATVTVGPEPCWWRDDVVAPWRLKWMAAADGFQGQGIGGLVLAAAVAHATASGCDLLWCNARLRAVPFYERAGFVVEGPEFPIAGIGPHHPMAVALPSGGTVPR